MWFQKQFKLLLLIFHWPEFGSSCKGVWKIWFFLVAQAEAGTVVSGELRAPSVMRSEVDVGRRAVRI